MPDIHRLEYGYTIAVSGTQILDALAQRQFQDRSIPEHKALTKSSSSIRMYPFLERTTCIAVFSADQCTLEPCRTAS